VISRSCILSLLACVALEGACTTASAAQLVIGDPNAYQVGQNAFPFSTLPAYYGHPSTRYQQVYAASEFGGPIDIHELVFFATSNTQAPIPDSTIQLFLSVTDRGVNEISYRPFDDNLGADTRLFATLGGGLSLTNAELVIGGVPFYYDPAQGNLLLDLRVSGATAGQSGPFFAALAGDGSGPMPFSRWHDFGIGFDNRGLVTGFRSNVTEPGALALLGLGLTWLGLSRRRKAA
jgi:hypothetical protein